MQTNNAGSYWQCLCNIQSCALLLVTYDRKGYWLLEHGNRDHFKLHYCYCTSDLKS